MESGVFLGKSEVARKIEDLGKRGSNFSASGDCCLEVHVGSCWLGACGNFPCGEVPYLHTVNAYKHVTKSTMADEELKKVGSNLWTVERL